MFDIKPYEAMAKFDLPGDERAKISAQAGMLVESFAALEKIKTDGVPPLVTVLDIQNVLREDVSAKLFSREELLANAPESHDGYFQVPKTLE